MKFQNKSPSAELNFTICGMAYKVAPDGEVDIRDDHVKYVYSRGIFLTPKTSKPSPTPKKVDNAPTGGEGKDKALPRVS